MSFEKSTAGLDYGVAASRDVAPVINEWWLEDNVEGIADLLDAIHDLVGFWLQRMRHRLPNLHLSDRLTRLHRFLLRDHPNVVRLLGSHLPYQPTDCRFLIRTHSGYGGIDGDSHWEAEDNMAQVPSLNDVVEVVNKRVDGDDTVRHRWTTDDVCRSPDMRGVSPVKKLNKQPASRKRPWAPTGGVTSTPVMVGRTFSLLRDASSLLSDDDDDGSVIITQSGSDDKIANLERELNELRKQMASIIQLKETERKNDKAPLITADGDRPKSRSSEGSSDSGVDPDPDEMSVGGKPAPPPPPPPPPPPSVDFLKTSQVVLPKKQPSGSVPTRTAKSMLPSMSDVLKDLHKVQLKKVSDRSPGGTPSRRQRQQQRRLSAVDSDPGAFIAAALMRKFAGVARAAAADSPTQNLSPSSPWNSSWDSSPGPNDEGDEMPSASKKPRKLLLPEKQSEDTAQP